MEGGGRGVSTYRSLLASDSNLGACRTPFQRDEQCVFSFVTHAWYHRCRAALGALSSLSLVGKPRARASFRCPALMAPKAAFTAERLDRIGANAADAARRDLSGEDPAALLHLSCQYPSLFLLL